MKTKIPDKLKMDVPGTSWGKVLTATPVIMTVVATALAGLSSSEMSRAQYNRSLAAQQQAKAGDQWGFFQAKRLRGSMQRTTLDLIQATADVRPIGLGILGKLDVASASALAKGELPPLPPAVEMKPTVKTALELLEAAKPEGELFEVLNGVTADELTDAVRAHRGRADAFDATLKRLNQAIDGLEKSLGEADRDTRRNFAAARARYTVGRYEAEARLNQSVAQLIELQVRKSNLTAERHSRRSQRFFFGMLAAQAAVIVSTFSIAATKRSALWTVAAAAGVTAIAFAIWVYFYV